MKKERYVFVNWSNYPDRANQKSECNFSDLLTSDFCLFRLAPFGHVDEVSFILGNLGGFVIYISRRNIRVRLGKFSEPAAIFILTAREIEDK